MSGESKKGHVLEVPTFCGACLDYHRAGASFCLASPPMTAPPLVRSAGAKVIRAMIARNAGAPRTVVMLTPDEYDEVHRAIAESVYRHFDHEGHLLFLGWPVEIEPA